MTNPTGQRGGTPWYVTVTDGLLFLIDTLVITVVIGGLVGLVAGGTQHPLYELTIGLIYGLVTSPGVTGFELVVYLALILAVTGPVWHSRLRSRYATATGDGPTGDFEFSRETGSGPSSVNGQVLPYSDGGALRPRRNPLVSGAEWASMVFDEPPGDEPGPQGDFYRSPGKATWTSQAEQSAETPTTDESVDGQPAAVAESAPSEPDELAHTTPDPTARLAEALEASRSRIDAVSAGLPSNTDTADLDTMAAELEAIRADAADTIGHLEDVFSSIQRTPTQDARLREGERDVEATITSALKQ